MLHRSAILALSTVAAIGSAALASTSASAMQPSFAKADHGVMNLGSGGGGGGSGGSHLGKRGNVGPVINQGSNLGKLGNVGPVINQGNNLGKLGNAGPVFNP